MESWMKTLWKCLLVFAVIAFTAPNDVDARRGGGGGSRGGGSRTSSRSRGGTKTGSSRARTAAKISSYRGPVYKSSYWKTGMAVGMVYGLSSYRHRRRYHDHPDREPTVCFNVENLHNHTYGYFICPEPSQPDSYEHCCGDEGEQSCCEYFDDAGRIAGVVIGVIVGAVVLGVAIYCICKRCRRPAGGPGYVVKGDKTQTTDDGFPDQSIPLQDGYGAPQPNNDIPLPDTSAWGVQPGGPNGPGGTATGYDTGEGGLPYNPHPADYPAPPPGPMPYPAPQGPAPDGPAPYPSQPIGYQTDGAGEKPPMPAGDVSGGLPYSSDPYTAGPGVGFTYNTPTAPPPGDTGYAPVAGQPYPAVAPPPYPAN